jgi:haloalkane dehalogenase
MSAPISAEYPFASHFVTVHGARVHYVDEGEGDPIVFLHGNPTWSYVWRNVIPHVRGVGRCIAPDLVGMGKSEKPQIGYRFVDHARYLDGFIRALGLERIVFVLHDWGSALGFDWAMKHEPEVRGLAFMEAVLTPLESWNQFPEGARDLFRTFRTPGAGEKLIMDDNMFIEQVLPFGVERGLTPAEMAQYRAPFPDRESRRPLWVWPNEIPIEGQPADVADAVARYRDALCRSRVPKLLFAAEPGAVTPLAMVAWCEAQFSDLEVVKLGSGRHFLQEDHPHEIGAALATWVRKTRAREASEA